MPNTWMQHGGAGLDPLFEGALIVKREDRHAAEFRALVAARLGIDDRRAAFVALARPERPAAAAKPLLGLAEKLGLEAFRLLAQDGSCRIIKRRRKRAYDERHKQSRSYKLPGRDAGAARNDQFKPP